VFVNKGIVLRGDGPGATRLEGDDVSYWAILQIGELWDEDGSPVASIQAGATKGSRSLVVGDASSFDVGDLVLVDQENDGDLFSLDASESECTWGSREDGGRLQAQIVEVVSIDGNTIGIDPGLAMDYAPDLAPEITRLHSRITRYAGVEDLSIADRGYRGGNNANIRFHAL